METVEQRLAELLRKAETSHAQYERGVLAFEDPSIRPGLGWPEYYSIFMLRYGAGLVGLEIVPSNDEE